VDEGDGRISPGATVSRSDGHPTGFICDCGIGIDFPEVVHAHWHLMFEATCKKCGAVWKGRRGAMRRWGSQNIVTPRLLN